MRSGEDRNCDTGNAAVSLFQSKAHGFRRQEPGLVGGTRD
jgi:hypothetical protein